MSVFRFLMVVVLVGAVAGARGQALATNLLDWLTQETIGENYKITQRLTNDTPEPWYAGWDFYKLDIEENLSKIGCTNIGNTIGWTYEETSSETCRLENTLPSIDHRTYSAKNFYYEVPTNLVVGWEFVTATFTANNGDTANLDGGFKVPLTYSTTAHGGGNPMVELLNQAGQLPLTNEITRADIEYAATNTINGREAWLNWLLWNDVSNAVPWECSLVLTNGGFRLSWPSVSGRTYTVERSTNLTNGFSVISPPLPGLPPGNWFESINMPTNAFYRVKVQK